MTLAELCLPVLRRHRSVGHGIGLRRGPPELERQLARQPFRRWPRMEAFPLRVRGRSLARRLSLSLFIATGLVMLVPRRRGSDAASRVRMARARAGRRQGGASRLTGRTGPLRSGERQRLSHGALALRAGHTTIALVELSCLGYVWTCALTGRRDPVLHGAIGVLVAEGVGLVIGRGNCPLGPLQQRFGDPVPLFELVLPPAWARRAVPILAGASGIGIALALRPIRR